MATSERLHLIDEICGEFLKISEDRELTEPIFRRDGSETFTVDAIIEQFDNLFVGLSQ